MGAEIARGLVAVDNIGSQRAFAKCGYETDGVICELMIAVDAGLFPCNYCCVMIDRIRLLLFRYDHKLLRIMGRR